jgi:hypothetical protein
MLMGFKENGVLSRASCRPSNSCPCRCRHDAGLDHRMVLQVPPLLLRAQLPPECPSSDRRNNHWRGIHRAVRDESRRRIRLRLKRPNCPELDYSPTAWPASQPLTIRQQQQREVKRKTYSFVISLSERLLHPHLMLSADLTGHNRSRARYAKNRINVLLIGFRIRAVRFGSKADTCGAIAHVCFVPEADSCSAADHTIAAQPKPGGTV